MTTLDRFLRSQFDVCGMVCGRLDPVSLSALSRTNPRLKGAVSSFFRHPLLLLEDDGGDFTRTYDPITGHVQEGTRLEPALVAQLDAQHPKGRGDKRRVSAVDNGCPDLLMLESRRPGRRQFTLVLALESSLGIMPVSGLPCQHMSPRSPPPVVLPRDFIRTAPLVDLGCPVVDIARLLPRRVVEMHRSLRSRWVENPANSATFEQTYWARDLKVLVVRKDFRLWLVDPLCARRVMVPEFIDVVVQDGAPFSRVAQPQNMTYQDGQLFVLGVTFVWEGQRYVRHKKLFVFDLRAYVCEWRSQDDKALQEQFVARVGSLYENHVGSSMWARLEHLSPGARANLAMIVGVINTGVVVASKSALCCLGRVPRLGGRTHMDTFPGAGLVVLRSINGDRHYLVATKKPSRIVGLRSFRDAQITSHSLLPYYKSYVQQ